MEGTKAYIGLGSNQERPAGQIAAAFAALAALPDTRLTARSALYRTAPLGYLSQPDFVNAVAEVVTTLSPQALLRELLRIEREAGRIRLFADGPRTLDLDLLLYGDLAIDEPDLVVPHPRLHERAFALLPLLEIAPQSRIPGRGAAAEWAGACTGQRIARLDAQIA